MLCMSHLNARHFRILICIPLLLGVWSAMTPPRALHISEVWPDGPATVVISHDDTSEYQLAGIDEHNEKIAVNRVVINMATHEQLMSCPGIGSKTAALIIKERSFSEFYDWRDLHDRVKGMSNTKIENLKEAGVRLNANDPTDNR